VFERALDRALEVVDDARLDEVVVDALPERVNRRLDGGVAGEDDGHEAGVLGLQLVEQRDAVHVLHAEVCEDEVERAAGDLLEGLGAVGGRLDVVALLFEDGGGRDADVLLVVDDEQAVAAAAAAVGGAGRAVSTSAVRHRFRRAWASRRG
jgi:hypothetical protein